MKSSSFPEQEGVLFFELTTACSSCPFFSGSEKRLAVLRTVLDKGFVFEGFFNFAMVLR